MAPSCDVVNTEVCSCVHFAQSKLRSVCVGVVGGDYQWLRVLCSKQDQICRMAIQNEVEWRNEWVNTIQSFIAS